MIRHIYSVEKYKGETKSIGYQSDNYDKAVNYYNSIPPSQRKDYLVSETAWNIDNDEGAVYNILVRE